VIKVFLIEDQNIVRQSIRCVLTGARGISFVGEAATGKEGLALAKVKNPDVLLLDFSLPDTNGLELAPKLLRYLPELKVLIVTAMQNDVLPTRLLDIGVHGYLTKENDAAELLQAIRRVHSGQRYLSPDVANRLALSKVTGGGVTPFDQLSEREMEVLLLLAKGLNAEAIAKQLCISAKTVNSYRYRMFDKLQVKNDVELIKLAIQHRLIEIDSIKC